jgi:hypothetical protein
MKTVIVTGHLLFIGARILPPGVIAKLRRTP